MKKDLIQCAFSLGATRDEIDHLIERAAIKEYDGGLTRYESDMQTIQEWIDRSDECLAKSKK